MNTLSQQVPHKIETKIQLTDISREELKDLAEKVTQWQQHAKFMHFLKEKPMNIQQNREIFQKEIDTQHCIFQGIQLEGVSDLVGFLLFHNFDPKDNSVELGFRVDPNNQSKGVCTHAVQASLHKILERKEIDQIVGWHSAFNK